MNHFILVRSGSGSSVALILRQDAKHVWVRKWRTSRNAFAKHVQRRPIAEVVGDVRPNDPRRLAAEAAIRLED